MCVVEFPAGVTYFLLMSCTHMLGRDSLAPSVPPFLIEESAFGSKKLFVGRPTSARDPTAKSLER